MFRKDDLHLHFPLFSSIDSLPEKRLKRLEASRAGTFYREFLVRIDSVKHPFRNVQVPVRGRPRVWMVMIGSASMSNMRSKMPFRVRIFRYQASQNSSKANKTVQKGPKPPQEQPVIFSFAALWARIRAASLLQPAFVFSC